MAVNKVINSVSLTLEVQSGTDMAGLPVYKKKSFSGVKLDAAAQNVFDVAEAIKAVLNGSTRDYYLNETSKIASV